MYLRSRPHLSAPARPGPAPPLLVCSVRFRSVASNPFPFPRLPLLVPLPVPLPGSLLSARFCSVRFCCARNFHRPFHSRSALLSIRVFVRLMIVWLSMSCPSLFLFSSFSFSSHALLASCDGQSHWHWHYMYMHLTSASSLSIHFSFYF